MSTPIPLKLLFLEGTAERSLLELAGEALSSTLVGAEPSALRVPAMPIAQLAGAPLLASQRWDLVLLALTAELDLEHPSMAERARLLGAEIEALQARGAAVALATIFRHVPVDHARRAALRTRIRELNLMVRRLSHQHGCFVLDLDREFAHEGALKLGADWFGGGEAAAEVAISELMVLALEMLGDRLTEGAA